MTGVGRGSSTVDSLFIWRLRGTVKSKCSFLSFLLIRGGSRWWERYLPVGRGCFPHLAQSRNTSEHTILVWPVVWRLALAHSLRCTRRSGVWCEEQPRLRPTRNPANLDRGQEISGGRDYQKPRLVCWQRQSYGTLQRYNNHRPTVRTRQTWPQATFAKVQSMEYRPREQLGSKGYMLPHREEENTIDVLLFWNR